MSSHIRPSRGLALGLLSGLLLWSIAATGAVAQSPAAVAHSPAPVAQPTIPATVPGPDPTEGAIPAVPDPRIVDARPRPWERIEVAPDGRTLTVYFRNGDAACYGLKDVEVAVVDGVTTVIVMTGMTPEARSISCVEVLFLYKTLVVLDAPILGGGAS